MHERNIINMSAKRHAMPCHTSRLLMCFLCSCATGYHLSSPASSIGVCSIYGTWLFSPEPVCLPNICSPLMLSQYVTITQHSATQTLNIMQQRMSRSWHVRQVEMTYQ